MAGTYDVQIDQGSTFSISFQYRDVLFNNLFLNAVSATGMVRDGPLLTANLLATFTCTFSTDGNTLTAVLPATESINLTKKLCYYDILVTYPAGVVEHVLAGKANINLAVAQ